jgi:hypothetical protein
VKATIEFPDELFHAVQAKAAQNGISLKDFVAEALQEKLGHHNEETGKKIWMKHFGSLSHLRQESRKIEKIIEDEFGLLLWRGNIK